MLKLGMLELNGWMIVVGGVHISMFNSVKRSKVEASIRD